MVVNVVTLPPPLSPCNHPPLIIAVQIINNLALALASKALSICYIINPPKNRFIILSIFLIDAQIKSP